MDDTIEELKALTRPELVAEHKKTLRTFSTAGVRNDDGAASDAMDRAEIISAELDDRDLAAAVAVEDRFAGLRNAAGGIDPGAVTGADVSAVAASEYDSFLGSARQLRRGDMAEYFRGLALGTWTVRAAELLDQSAGLEAEGGALVPTPVAAMVHELVMARLAARQAGATIVPLTALTNKLPKLTNRGAAAWRAEAATIGKTSLTFGTVTFTANSLSALVLLSRELLADSAANFEEYITAEIAKTLALELDRAFWNGTGAGAEPDGLIDATGVTDTAHGGVAPTWAAEDAMLRRVVAKDYTPTAIVAHPPPATLPICTRRRSPTAGRRNGPVTPPTSSVLAGLIMSPLRRSLPASALIPMRRWRCAVTSARLLSAFVKKYRCKC